LKARLGGRDNVACGESRGIAEGGEVHQPRQWGQKEPRADGDYVAPPGAYETLLLAFSPYGLEGVKKSSVMLSEAKHLHLSL